MKNLFFSVASLVALSLTANAQATKPFTVTGKINKATPGQLRLPGNELAANAQNRLDQSGGG